MPSYYPYVLHNFHTYRQYEYAHGFQFYCSIIALFVAIFFSLDSAAIRFFSSCWNPSIRSVLILAVLLYTTIACMGIGASNLIRAGDPYRNMYVCASLYRITNSLYCSIVMLLTLSSYFTLFVFFVFSSLHGVALTSSIVLFRRMERKNIPYEYARARARMCVCVRAFTSHCLPVLGIVRIGSVRFTTNVIQPAHSFTKARDGFFRNMYYVRYGFFHIIFCTLLSLPSIISHFYLAFIIWKMLVFAVPCHAGSKKFRLWYAFVADSYFVSMY